ncbi:MAG TPA: hypothetical protein VN681_01290 [Stellaceae bacterium]|nr:hypothetical protein [Stellaceae bacterium]
MKVGDKVRVIGVPHLDGLPEETKQLFRACIGGVFEITDERQIPGLSKEFELLVRNTQVDAEHHELESIWIEVEFIEPE